MHFLRSCVNLRLEKRVSADRAGGYAGKLMTPSSRLARRLRSLAAFGLLAAGPLVRPVSAQLVPGFDHIVVVVLENHSYQEVLGTAGPEFPPASLPFINGFLRPGGADMTQAYGIQHPSQPNYYWLFSGSNQGVILDDAPTGPFSSQPNLYTALDAKGLTFGGYINGYPGASELYAGQVSVPGTIGNSVSGNITYATRHMPWLGFTNVPATVSRDFSLFGSSPADFASLPQVSFVIPALENDMHNYESGKEVSSVHNSKVAMENADAWLEANLKAYALWAKNNNSLLILTTDEDSTADWVTPPLTVQNYYPTALGENAGLTSPTAGPSSTASGADGTAQSGPNQITTIFYGASVIPGSYAEGNGITNVNVLRTIEASFNLEKSGAQSGAITTIGDGPITSIFEVPEPAPLALLTLAMALGVFRLHRRRGDTGA